MDGNGDHEGRVEIYYEGEWGTVCDEGWGDNDARTVCIQLGYRNGYASRRNDVEPGSGTVWLELVDCEDDERALIDCPHSGWGDSTCDHDQDAGVDCEG